MKKPAFTHLAQYKPSPDNWFGWCGRRVNRMNIVSELTPAVTCNHCRRKAIAAGVEVKAHGKEVSLSQIVHEDSRNPAPPILAAMLARSESFTEEPALAVVLSAARSWADDLPEQVDHCVDAEALAEKEAAAEKIYKAISTIEGGERCTCARCQVPVNEADRAKTSDGRVISVHVMTRAEQVAADILEFSERCAEREETDTEHAWDHLRAAYCALTGKEWPNYDDDEEEVICDDCGNAGHANCSPEEPHTGDPAGSGPVMHESGRVI